MPKSHRFWIHLDQLDFVRSACSRRDLCDTLPTPRRDAFRLERESRARGPRLSLSLDAGYAMHFAGARARGARPSRASRPPKPRRSRRRRAASHAYRRVTVLLSLSRRVSSLFRLFGNVSIRVLTCLCRPRGRFVLSRDRHSRPALRVSTWSLKLFEKRPLHLGIDSYCASGAGRCARRPP